MEIGPLAFAGSILPSSSESSAKPRFKTPITLVVMPEECQSMPITAPKDWNQKGWAQLVAAIMMDDRLAHHRAETGHAIRQPSRHLPAMQRKVGASSSLYHLFSRESLA
jgi:hypothetical protein